MATYTENYGLHQWESTDDFIRTDFNEDFLKIDTAIKGVEEDVTEAMTEGLAVKCEVVIGSYTGDNATSRVISLGFRPKAVILETNYGFHGTKNISNVYSGLILEDSPLINDTYDAIAGAITDDGFEVYTIGASYVYTNLSGSTYHYIAFK